MTNEQYNEYASLFPLIGKDPHYRQCSISVMDNIADTKIFFDRQGRCNYYYVYKRTEKRYAIKGEAGRLKWKQTVDYIKTNKGNTKYDCLIGLSGGIDSSYICLLAKEAGLNPLVIHLDNTWDSEQSVINIENALEKLGFDYETLVIDNKTFELLQKAYILSSVVDLDLITDHAILISLYETAVRHGIKHVITGYNVYTETTLSPDWLFDWRDHKNMMDIIRFTYPDMPDLETYPNATFSTIKKLSKKADLTFYDPINWLDYNVKKVETEIGQKLNWKPFSGKHHESVWTRFFQCYILPVKYKIDKRKAHLSNLIYSGQMTKAQALEILHTPPYTYELLRNDMALILNRLGWTYEEFQQIMAMPPKKHTDFAYRKTIRNQLSYFFTLVHKLRMFIESERQF